MPMIINADCLDAMASMRSDSIDAIVTDPPYGIAFMGVEWDSFGDSTGAQTVAERKEASERYAEEHLGAPRYGNSHGKPVKLSDMKRFEAAMEPAFAEMLRVAKPGAHLLCFGGTRTFHRMACAVEDAGWEIRDCIMWVYGSGFPKSLDVSKAIDRELGAEREKVVVPADKVRNPKSIKGGHGVAGGDRPWMARAIETGYHVMDGDKPATEEAERWDGWGTCLKPAWEPVIVARKPVEGTIANNVLEYGTGALNIGACRVGNELMVNNPAANKPGGNSLNMSLNGMPEDAAPTIAIGRFPANLVHDGSEEVTGLFPNTGVSSGGGGVKAAATGGLYGTFAPKNSPQNIGFGDNGSAARFFYCAKASPSDRGAGNDHPTVKPVELMRWLVKLVCKPGGTVLDPFCGSGSTGVACVNEGMDFIGIERDEHFSDIARRRVDEALPYQPSLF